MSGVTRADTDARAIESFVTELTWSKIPFEVRRRLAWLLLDFTAVSIAGRPAPAARIAAEYASEAHAGDASTALFDGRRLSIPGAAWANGVLANAVDYDDGHRLTKGHPGANVIPAALAAAEAAGSSLEEFLTAVSIGYEVAIRAGVRLHTREEQYHASAAWGGLGAATAVSRLFGLDAARVRHALGLAEYHAPIALMMRSVADPAMTKDATGWGAFLGVSSAMLARGGYTALASTFLTEEEQPDVGERWELLNVYVKAYPCCRWTQPAIEAALSLRAQRTVRAEAIRRIAIRTFAAAGGIACRQPETTEEAQYSLVWPVAAALVRGSFSVEDVLSGFNDQAVATAAGRTSVTIDPELTAVFPERRFAEVSVEFEDGTILKSGALEARGDPDDPGWETVVDQKLRRFVSPSVCSPAVKTVDPPTLCLSGRTLEELIGILTYCLAEDKDVLAPCNPHFPLQKQVALPMPLPTNEGQRSAGPRGPARDRRRAG